MRMDVGIAGVGCPMRIALVIELKIIRNVGMVEKNIRFYAEAGLF